MTSRRNRSDPAGDEPDTAKSRSITSTTFAALATPNFRKFFIAQGFSVTGTWMQSVALAWLVLQLTRSPAWLGVAVALQFIPVLVFSPYAGVVVDRVRKRRLLVVTQSAFTLLAVILGVVTITGRVTLTWVLAIEIGFGIVSAADGPGRQAFVGEMVAREQVPNAVTLNSVLANATRAIGPAVAGVLIATVSLGLCFVVNAFTFAGVVVALLLMDGKLLRICPPGPREPGQFRAGLRYVRRNPELRTSLLMLALVGMLTYEFSVVLPSLVDLGFNDSAQSLGWMLSAMGFGAIAGGLVVAAKSLSGLRVMTAASAVFGAAYLVLAFAPGIVAATVILFFVGAASVWFMSVGNSTVQLAAPGKMRGRVMALWSVAMVDSTSVGGPLMGWVANTAGPRWAVAVGACAALAAAVIGWAGALARAAARWLGGSCSPWRLAALVTVGGFWADAPIWCQDRHGGPSGGLRPPWLSRPRPPSP